jgi:hypothetical protein
VKCDVDFCEKVAEVRGWCRSHWEQQHRGKPFTVPRKLHDPRSEDAFWERVDKSGECWLWTAGRTSMGYGKVHMPNRKTGLAHRRAYQLVNGPIPDGLVLDHLCRTPLCVRPDHLEPVTMRENTVRGATSLDFTGMCRAGLHDVAVAGAVVSLTRGKRTCLECKRLGERRRRAVLDLAAKRLGLSRNAYEKLHGMSTAVARKILGEHA